MAVFIFLSLCSHAACIYIRTAIPSHIEYALWLCWMRKAREDIPPRAKGTIREAKPLEVSIGTGNIDSLVYRGGTGRKKERQKKCERDGREYKERKKVESYADRETLLGAEVRVYPKTSLAKAIDLKFD